MMRFSGLYFLLGAVVIGLFSGPAHAEIRVAGIFGDGLVLQRDSSAPVWGTGSPGEEVRLDLDGKTVSCRTDSTGRWKATFQNLSAGGPYDLKITGISNALVLQNVLVGDVWICSGQSNMEFPMAWLQNEEAMEIQSAADPLFHSINIANQASLEPATNVQGQWRPCDPQNVLKFTAVGYYFGKELRRENNVPVGLINASWGAASAESFVSNEALHAISGQASSVDNQIEEWRSRYAAATKFLTNLNAWANQHQRQDSGNKGFPEGWAAPDFDASTWRLIHTPGDWTSLDVPYGGIVWLRKKISLPASASKQQFALGFGSVTAPATVYFNGEEVGTLGKTPPFFFTPGQVVTIPARLVKNGDNLIALRVVSQKPHMGTFGSTASMHLPEVDPSSIPDIWAANVEVKFPLISEEDMAQMPTPPQDLPQHVPTLLFNGMIHPLLGYGIRGVIWYQGEANVERAAAYSELFPMLIADWRKLWGIGDFPFYFVQLANLGRSPKAAGETIGSDWAELREAQRLTLQRVSNTGMAVTIDIGDPNSIHPKNKRDLGHRLALIALAKSSNKSMEYSGPIYDSMSVEGSCVRLKFSHTGKGLVAKGGELKQFAIAGIDKRWVWADAKIDGATVVVSSASVSAPVAVRYAWAENPEGCNLYNEEGLPASPFRTDNWPLLTIGK